MSINGIGQNLQVNKGLPMALKTLGINETSNHGNDFAAFLNQALDKVNRQQMNEQNLTDKFVSGELKDVHTLEIASQKASLGLQLTVQVRNKVIEAYQEVMRMQV